MYRLILFTLRMCSLSQFFLFISLLDATGHPCRSVYPTSFDQFDNDDEN